MHILTWRLVKDKGEERPHDLEHMHPQHSALRSPLGCIQPQSIQWPKVERQWPSSFSQVFLALPQLLMGWKKPRNKLYLLDRFTMSDDLSWTGSGTFYRDISVCTQNSKYMQITLYIHVVPRHIIAPPCKATADTLTQRGWVETAPSTIQRNIHTIQNVFT